jgi:hypothetical protein
MKSDIPRRITCGSGSLVLRICVMTLWSKLSRYAEKWRSRHSKTEALRLQMKIGQEI